jgi:hypothetical protein
MSRTDKGEREQVWSVLSEAGLINIPAQQVPERIKEAKYAVMQRLGELLETAGDTQERDSAAHSLATLKKVETAFADRSRD